MTRRILRTPEAAEYVGLSASTLEKKRVTGDGPEFIRLGGRAVGYDVAALDAWLDAEVSSEELEKLSTQMRGLTEEQARQLLAQHRPEA